MTKIFLHEPLSLNVLIQLLCLCKSHLSILHCNFAKEIYAIALLLARPGPIYNLVFVQIIESYEIKYVVGWCNAVYS